MEESGRAFISEHGRLPQTADEDPWIGELGGFMPGLERYEQSKKK
jgi:hypothetical protein